MLLLVLCFYNWPILRPPRTPKRRKQARSTLYIEAPLPVPTKVLAVCSPVAACTLRATYQPLTRRHPLPPSRCAAPPPEPPRAPAPRPHPRPPAPVTCTPGRTCTCILPLRVQQAELLALKLTSDSQPSEGLWISTPRAMRRTRPWPRRRKLHLRRHLAIRLAVPRPRAWMSTRPTKCWRWRWRPCGKTRRKRSSTPAPWECRA